MNRLVLVLFALALAAPALAHGHGDADLEVASGVHTVTLPPGATVEVPLRLHNPGPLARPVSLQAHGEGVGGEVDPPRFDLPPGQSQDVTVRLTAGTAPGWTQLLVQDKGAYVFSWPIEIRAGPVHLDPAGPWPRPSAYLRPSALDGYFPPTELVDLHLRNAGPERARLSLGGYDVAQRVEVAIQPSTLELDPGQAGTATVVLVRPPSTQVATRIVLQAGPEGAWPDSFFSLGYRGGPAPANLTRPPAPVRALMGSEAWAAQVPAGGFVDIPFAYAFPAGAGEVRFTAQAGGGLLVANEPGAVTAVAGDAGVGRLRVTAPAGLAPAVQEVDIALRQGDRVVASRSWTVRVEPESGTGPAWSGANRSNGNPLVLLDGPREIAAQPGQPAAVPVTLWHSAADPLTVQLTLRGARWAVDPGPVVLAPRTVTVVPLMVERPVGQEARLEILAAIVGEEPRAALVVALSTPPPPVHALQAALAAAAQPEVAVGLGSAGILVAGLSGRRSLGWALLAPAAFFTRLRPGDALAHPTRRDLLARIEAAPGITYSELRAATGLSAGVLGHHLRTLQAHRHVVSRREAGRRRFWTPQAQPPPVLTLAQAALLAQLAAGARSSRELAEALGRSRQAVEWHLRRLAGRGLVRAQTESGRKTWVRSAAAFK